jgi:hypothetical protein
VTYWALADMVRWRCRITEDEQPGSALPKLRSTLEEYMTDPDERRFVEPRLAHLLGLGEHESHERQDLFAAWRLFFERMAEQNPLVMVFEDLQWADASLLDFVEYLLEWSRNSPLCVITLPGPSCSSSGRPGAPVIAIRLALPRASLAESMDELLNGSFPVYRALAEQISPAPRRPLAVETCGCCSTVASSSRKARSTDPSARSRRSRYRKRFTR